MEQKTRLWQRRRRALSHTILQKVQCSFPPPQMAVWHWATVGASLGGERRCWRMCCYVFPQVSPPWQSCARTTDLAGVMESCLPLQLSRDLPWHFACLWAWDTVVGGLSFCKETLDVSVQPLGGQCKGPQTSLTILEREMKIMRPTPTSTS